MEKGECITTEYPSARSAKRNFTNNTEGGKNSERSTSGAEEVVTIRAGNNNPLYHYSLISKKSRFKHNLKRSCRKGRDWDSTQGVTSGGTKKKGHAVQTHFC